MQLGPPNRYLKWETNCPSEPKLRQTAGNEQVQFSAYSELDARRRVDVLSLLQSVLQQVTNRSAGNVDRCIQFSRLYRRDSFIGRLEEWSSHRSGDAADIEQRKVQVV